MGPQSGSGGRKEPHQPRQAYTRAATEDLGCGPAGCRVTDPAEPMRGPSKSSIYGLQARREPGG